MGAHHGRSCLAGVRSFGRLRKRRGSNRTRDTGVACGSGFARGGREQSGRRLEERRTDGWPADRSWPGNCEEGRREICQCGRDGAKGNWQQDRAEGQQQIRRRQARGIHAQISTRSRSGCQCAATPSLVSHVSAHLPVPEYQGIISSIAYPFSPPELPRGPVYRFSLNHVVIPDHPCEMFRAEILDI